MNKELLYEGSKIFYRILGSGKSVVLLHGFGEDSNIWKNQVEFLKDKFQLIIPDLPGSGPSTMDNGPWTMDRFAGVLKSILEKESIKECVLIGHSMGGYITLAFAEKYPGFLRAFGLFHSSAFADNEEKKATRRKGIEFIQKHGSKAFLETVIPNLFAPIPIAIGTKSLIPPKESLRTNSIKELIDKSDNFSPTAL